MPNKVFVLQFEHTNRQYLPPMLHESVIFAIVDAHVPQIIGKIIAQAKFVKVNGQASV